MYGIFTYIWVVFGVNVGKYTIHWASGYSNHTLGAYIGGGILMTSCIMVSLWHPLKFKNQTFSTGTTIFITCPSHFLPLSSFFSPNMFRIFLLRGIDNWNPWWRNRSFLETRGKRGDSIKRFAPKKKTTSVSRIQDGRAPTSYESYKWVFPKIVVLPNHPF